MQGKCSNCDTTQGPFERVKMQKPLCRNVEACMKRRNKLDRERWEIKLGVVKRDDE